MAVQSDGSKRSWLLIGVAAAVVVAVFFVLGVVIGKPPLHLSAARLRDRTHQGVSEFTENDDHTAVQDFFSATRVGVGKAVPVDRYLIAQAKIQAAINRTGGALAGASTGAEGAIDKKWTFLGPGNVGGRTRALVADPRDPKVLYTGGVAGGVWKSIDGGGSWTPLTDTFSNVAVSALALDPTDPSIVYAGTGELQSNREEEVRGVGILKSTDGGVTWAILPATQNVADFHVVNDIQISHTDPNRMYAATTTGTLLSTDGGATWAVTLPGQTPAGCMTLALRTDKTPDVIFANCAAGRPNGVYRSVDGGTTWEKLIDTVNGSPVGFTAIAIAPSNQDIVYAAPIGGVDLAHPENFTGNALGLLRSDHGGDNGTWQIVNPADGSPGHPYFLAHCGGRGAQGSYGNVLAVDPTDPNRLFAGGIDMYRSDDGGQTMRIAGYWWLHQELGLGDGTPYVHADHHKIVFSPTYNGQSNKDVYFIGDGGLFVSHDDRVPLDSDSCSENQGTGSLNQQLYDTLNRGYGVTQFWGGAVSDDGSILMGGTQDNGSYITRVADGIDGWSLVMGGDGFRVAIAPDNSAFYGEYPGSDGIAIAKSENGAQGTFRVITNSIHDKGLFVTPFILDPNDPNTLWTGGTFMWRSTDGGTTWVQSSAALAPPPSGDQKVTGLVSAIAVAPGHPEIVYVATSTGQVFHTTNGTDSPPTWTDVTGTLPTGDNGFVPWIAVDPTDPNVAYVTHSYFDVGHVWKTTDGGTTWQNLDQALPNVPMSTFAINPLNRDMVYVGTDIGVFESLDGGLTWAVANDDLVSTVVQQLVFRTGTSELYAFTYGRGVYRVDVGAGVAAQGRER